jgi:hypothetical protein
MLVSWIAKDGSMATDLSKIGEREKLKARKGDEPHWHRLSSGCYVGYRPSKRGGRGTWFARAYDADTRTNRRKGLGDFPLLTGHEVFAAAKREAEQFADQVECGGLRAERIETVADACRSYLEERPSSIHAGVFRRHVFDDPIAKVRLDKLRRHHLRAWRKRLEDAPALLSRSKRGAKRTKVRSLSTVNRDMTPLRAALARFLPPGAPNSDAAWQEALLPNRGADKRREIYLDRVERARLLECVPAEAMPFVRALTLLPLRPGAMAGLRAGDFDKRTRTLTVGRDKNGRPRQFTVPTVTGDFLAQQSKDKLPTALLFPRGNGQAWDKDSWKHPVKQAVVAAHLPRLASAYTLRHCVLTDLVRGRLPVLTVAQMAGTSVAMIERHYGHLVHDDAEEALAQLVV